MKKVKTVFLFALSIVFYNNTNAQMDTLKKYSNGNILLGKLHERELRSSKKTLLAKWNGREITYNFNGKKIEQIRLTQSGSNSKFGLFDNIEGVLLLLPEYDGINSITDKDYLGVLKTRQGDLIGIYDSKTELNIKPRFKQIIKHLNNNWLFAIGNSYGYIYDQKLHAVDSIAGIIKTKSVLYQNKTALLEVQLENSVGLLNIENKILTKPEWKRIHAIRGNTLIIGSDSGIGLYDLEKNKMITDFSFEREVGTMYSNERFLYKAGTWTVINSQGKIGLVIKADEILEAGSGTEAYFFLERNYWGLINKKGQVVQKPIWKSLHYTNQEKFEADFENGKSKWYTWQYKQIKEGKLLTSLTESDQQYSDMATTEGAMDMPKPVVDAYIPPVDETPPNSETKIFTKMEIDPAFMSDYLNEKEFIKQSILNYKKEQKFNSKGKVVLVYLIEKDGKVGNIRIESADNDAIVRASKAIMQKVKKWNPGLQNGRVVRGERRLEFEW